MLKTKSLVQSSFYSCFDSDKTSFDIHKYRKFTIQKVFHARFVLDFGGVNWITRFSEKSRGAVDWSNDEGSGFGRHSFILENGSLLYLPCEDVMVDGLRLEGVGVAPTVPVDEILEYSQGRDPLLEVALNKTEEIVSIGFKPSCHLCITIWKLRITLKPKYVSTTPEMFELREGRVSQILICRATIIIHAAYWNIAIDWKRGFLHPSGWQ